MANYNKVLLIGNLTRDPEMRYLPSGTPACEFGLAVNRRFKDSQSGDFREQTCFVDLVAYGRQGETLHQYMRKGRPIFVEGRLDFQSWETPEGQKRSKLRVVVENFQFLGSREEGGAPRSAPSREGAAGAGNQPSPNPRPMAIDEDDIPF